MEKNKGIPAKAKGKLKGPSKQQQLEQENKRLTEENEKLMESVAELNMRASQLEDQLADIRSQVSEQIAAGEIGSFDVIQCIGKLVEPSGGPHTDDYFLQLAKGDPADAKRSGLVRQAVMLAHLVKEEMDLYEEQLEAARRLDEAAAARERGETELREDGVEKSPELA